MTQEVNQQINQQVGRQVIVIPDLHGRPDLLKATIQRYPEAHYIVLGDAIDRGPRSIAVIEQLLDLRDKGRATLLMGNHERMAREGIHWYRLYEGTHDLGDYRKAMEGYQWWMKAGGDSIRAELGSLTLEKFPSIIEEYLRELKVVVYVTADGSVHTEPPAEPSVLISHAAPPIKHVQYPDPMSAAIWLRPFEGPFAMAEGVVYSIHGHTPVPTPVRLGKHLYIDLGAYETGRLAVVELSFQAVPKIVVFCGRGDPSRARKYSRFGEPVQVHPIELSGAPPRR